MVTLDDPRARAAYADERESLPRMSFGDHLDELRKRLLRSVLAVLGAILLVLPFHNQVMTIIIEPYRILWRDYFVEHVAALEQKEAAGALREAKEIKHLEFIHAERQRILDGTYPFPKDLPYDTGFGLPYELVAVAGLEDFFTFVLAALVFALVMASPVVIWQIWAFVAAGLYERERKIFYRYFPFMMVLLGSGVAFGYYFAVPYGLGFLIRMMVTGLVSSMLSVGNYFTFLFALTAAMGFVFQLPMVMVALQRIGLVRHRTYRKNWRLFVLAIFGVAAVITPPDPFSMLLMAAPTLLLYVLGLFLTWMARHSEPPELATPGGSPA